MKEKKLIVSKKRFFLIITCFIATLVFFFGIYINKYKHDKGDLTAVNQNYIVAEYFQENNNDSIKKYEVRYYPRVKKSYLVRVEKNGTKVEDNITEKVTEFINEYTDFSIGNESSSKVSNLDNYADDSGFIFTCSIEEIQEFLTKEATIGKMKFTYATSTFFECYIQNKEGSIMRGLLLYNADNTTGTLIYKQCNKDVIIPNITDFIHTVEESNDKK